MTDWYSILCPKLATKIVQIELDRSLILKTKIKLYCINWHPIHHVSTCTCTAVTMVRIQFLTILLTVTCFLGGVVSVTDKEFEVCTEFNSKTKKILWLSWLKTHREWVVSYST